MKKRDYNQFTKSDLPLDTSFISPASDRSSPLIASKPKITAIGKSTSDKVKKRQQNKILKPVTPVKAVPKTKLETMNENELAKLNDDTFKSYSYRARRNRTIIIILIILLLLSLLAFGVFFAVSDLGANCYVYVHGNTEYTTYIDGIELTMFRSPTNVQGNRIFEFDADIKINAQGSFKLAYTVKVYQGGKLIENTQVIKENTNITFNAETQRYETKTNVSGGEKINLLEGIAIDWQYEKNFKYK